MQSVLPVGWNAAGWTWYRLVNGVVQWRRELGTLQVLVGAVVPEPILARLEAADERVTGRVRMCGCMLFGRVVATPDMTALRTAPEMEPPTTSFETLDATGSTWWYVGFDE
jgi:hypothetical protein